VFAHKVSGSHVTKNWESRSRKRNNCKTTRKFIRGVEPAASFHGNPFPGLRRGGVSNRSPALVDSRGGLGQCPRRRLRQAGNGTVEDACCSTPLIACLQLFRFRLGFQFFVTWLPLTLCATRFDACKDPVSSRHCVGRGSIGMPDGRRDRRLDNAPATGSVTIGRPAWV